jgi:signal peptidase I
LRGMPPVAPPRPVPPPRGAPPPIDPPTQALPTSRNNLPPVRPDLSPTVRNLDDLKYLEHLDQQRFDAGMTDPGPFGRMAFETRPPVRPVRPPPADDRPFDLKPPVKPPVDDEPDDEPAPKPKSRRKLPFWIELPVLVVVALLLTFTIQTFVARVYVIPSGSMEQTLNGNNGTGDRILVDKVVYDFRGPSPGDVIVFKGPAGWDQTEFFVNNSSNPVTHWLHQIASSIGLAKPDEYDLVKRVVAVGGQTISCCDKQNRILVDGKALDEPYVFWQPDRGGPAQQLRFGPVTVPPGYLWVMGDNRNNSDDSRFQNGGGIHGVVPVANVIGKARTIIWPPSRWRGIGDHNPQAAAGIAAGAPAWLGVVPATGVGVLAGLPTLWFGRRFGKRLRAAAGIARQPR